MGANYKVFRSKVKVTENENVKIVFRAIFLKSGLTNLTYVKTKTKMITGPLYTYLWIHFTEMLRFVIFVCLYNQ